MYGVTYVFLNENYGYLIFTTMYWIRGWCTSYYLLVLLFKFEELQFFKII